MASGGNNVPLPDLHTKRLLNDLQITVVPTERLGESMTIGLVVRYGSAFDTESKGGLANLVSRMFGKATVDKTMQSIQDELSYIGATLEVKSDWDGFRFILKGESSKVERSLLLLYQVVAEAQFNEADFNSVKESLIEEIRKTPDPRRNIHARFHETLYSGTTYGRPIQGTYVTASNIGLGDVRLFYRRFFSPGQASLVVVGNVSPDQVLQRASRIWGVWVRKDDVPFTFLPPRNPAGRQVFFEDDPDSTAAQFIIGNLFPARHESAFVNARLAAHIFEARLTKALPTSLVTVATDGRRMSSPFYVRGQAAVEQAVEQIRTVERIAEELKTGEVSQRSWNGQGVFHRGIQPGPCNHRRHLQDHTDSELYHLGVIISAIFPAQVIRCDADAIRRAASQWIFPGGRILLVRGPAALLKPALQSIANRSGLEKFCRRRRPGVILPSGSFPICYTDIALGRWDCKDKEMSFPTIELSSPPCLLFWPYGGICPAIEFAGTPGSPQRRSLHSVSRYSGVYIRENGVYGIRTIRVLQSLVYRFGRSLTGSSSLASAGSPTYGWRPSHGPSPHRSGDVRLSLHLLG